MKKTIDFAKMSEAERQQFPLPDELDPYAAHFKQKVALIALKASQKFKLDDVNASDASR